MGDLPETLLFHFLQTSTEGYAPSLHPFANTSRFQTLHFGEMGVPL
jgi:hypothetical protein